MANHPEHICRFNDGEQSCDCYDEGFRQAVEEFKKEMRENPATKNLIEYQEQRDEDGMYVIVSRQALDEVLALLDSDEKA